MHRADKIGCASSGLDVVNKNWRDLTARTALIFLGLAILAWFALGVVRPSVGYAVCAEFAVMPADDDALEEWLRGQPAVVGHTVHVAREGARLEVFFILSRGLRGGPQAPDLQGACERLGYSGRTSPFVNCRGE